MFAHSPTLRSFQQLTILEEPRTLLPGDEFMVECGYDTTSRDTMTYGGAGSLQEMCITFAFVYPAPDMYKCVNRPSYAAQVAWAQELYDAGYLGMDNATLNYIMSTEESISQFGELPTTYWEAVGVTWTDQGDGQAMYDKLWTDEQYAERTQQCVVNDYFSSSDAYDYYIGELEAYEAEEDVCDDTIDPTSDPTSDPTIAPTIEPTSDPTTEDDPSEDDNSSDAMRFCMDLVLISFLASATFM